MIASDKFLDFMKMDTNSACPYKKLPKSAFWKHSVASLPPKDVEPVGAPKFQLKQTDKISTAGSCFAQHIARYLQKCGCNYFVTEPAPALLDQETAREFQYGLFSARFGNIYTCRQLLQLARAAYSLHVPEDSCWERNGRYLDPYRPSVEPRGFSSRTELVASRSNHYTAVRTMLEELDCFVFTLGLTETWENVADGSVYPVCPGCGFGTHDSNQHKFINLSCAQNVADLLAFLKLLFEVNATARVILTVSPVPLVATMSASHVLAATTYSKSVLRVCAEEVAQQFDNVSYFPSYEIIMGSYSRGRYFGEDLRSVVEEGVSHVMDVFFRSYMPNVNTGNENPKQKLLLEKEAEPLTINDSAAFMQKVADLICDEEILSRCSPEADGQVEMFGSGPRGEIVHDEERVESVLQCELEGGR